MKWLKNIVFIIKNIMQQAVTKNYDAPFIYIYSHLSRHGNYIEMELYCEKEISSPTTHCELITGTYYANVINQLAICIT